MGNCVACATPTVPPGDGRRLRPHRSVEGKAAAKEDGTAEVSVKADRVPRPMPTAATSDHAKTKIDSTRKAAEELLHDVETRGLPLRQVLAHLLPDGTDHATVIRCSPPWRTSPPKLRGKSSAGVVLPAAAPEAKRKTSCCRQKAEERLRIVETQGLPLHRVFAHLVPDTVDRAARSPQRESPPRLAKVDGSPVQLAAVKRRIGTKKLEELLQIVETDCSLPMQLLLDADEAAAVRRWRPALNIVPEVEE